MIVLLIVADSVRADAPGFGGGPPTPTLDALAAAGTVCTDAVASAAWTVPSLNALATGTFPHRVGVARWRHPFPRRRPTLMSAFAAAGFEVITAAHNPRYAFANTHHRGQVVDGEDLPALLAALQGRRGRDVFVLLHYWWTHLPYRNERLPRSAWKRLCDETIQALAEDPANAVPAARDAYHACLRYFDVEVLPRLLDAAPDALIAFTADHGETWGDSLPAGHRPTHLYDLHGRWLSDETTRVPLLLHGPGVPPGRLRGWVRGVDVAPTLCGLASVPWPGPLPDPGGPCLVERGIGADGSGLHLDGVDLGPRLRGETVGASDALTVTTYNAVHPGKYPRAGRRLWCRYGLREDAARWTWDGLHGLRTVDWTGDAPGWMRGHLARGSMWSRLASERAMALDVDAPRAKELFPRGDFAADDDEDLGERLATLGYADA